MDNKELKNKELENKELENKELSETEMKEVNGGILYQSRTDKVFPNRNFR